MDAAIETYWKPRFTDHYFLGQSFFGAEPTWRKLEPLIRQGEPALPVYEARIDESDDLCLTANYAVVITAITGQEDEALVRRLLASEDRGKWRMHATFATELILAAHSTRWKDDLVALQARPYFDAKRATRVLVRCHLHEALPLLESELVRDPMNSVAKYAIEELREWK